MPLASRLFLRHARALALAVLAACVWASWGGSRLEVDDQPTSIIRSDDAAFAQMEEVFEQFGSDDGTCLLLLEGSDPFTPAGAAGLRRVTDALTGLEGLVAGVTSLLDLRDPLGRPLVPEPEAGPERFAAARERARLHPLAADKLLGSDGTTNLVLAQLADETLPVAELRTLLAEMSTSTQILASQEEHTAAQIKLEQEALHRARDLGAAVGERSARHLALGRQVHGEAVVGAEGEREQAQLEVSRPSHEVRLARVPAQGVLALPLEEGEGFQRTPQLEARLRAPYERLHTEPLARDAAVGLVVAALPGGGARLGTGERLVRARAVPEAQGAAPLEGGGLGSRGGGRRGGQVLEARKRLLPRSAPGLEVGRGQHEARVVRTHQLLELSQGRGRVLEPPGSRQRRRPDAQALDPRARLVGQRAELIQGEGGLVA